MRKSTLQMLISSQKRAFETKKERPKPLLKVFTNQKIIQNGYV